MQLHRARSVCFEASQIGKKLRSDVETHVFFKMEVGHAYSKINWRTDPTDSLETHSMKVLYKTSSNESTVVKCKKVIYYSTKWGGGAMSPPPPPFFRP